MSWLYESCLKVASGYCFITVFVMPTKQRLNKPVKAMTHFRYQITPKREVNVGLILIFKI